MLEEFLWSWNTECLQTVWHFPQPFFQYDWYLKKLSAEIKNQEKYYYAIVDLLFELFFGFNAVMGLAVLALPPKCSAWSDKPISVKVRYFTGMRRRNFKIRRCNITVYRISINVLLQRIFNVCVCVCVAYKMVRCNTCIVRCWILPSAYRFRKMYFL